MKYIPELFNRASSGNFLGENAANGRVTVEPDWQLRETPPIYGNSLRGPFRYYTDGNPEEYEVPAIQSIQWNRSFGQDLATATITIYNSWHNLNNETPEMADKIGKPGYFWPKRGEGDSFLTWKQDPGKGAYKKDGTWDPNFSWKDVLVPDALLRTYEGWGGKPTDGGYVSIDQNIADDNITITGVWIINSVSAGSLGTMTLDCTDIGRILLDQIVFPPVIPGSLYPLEYYPDGKSAFDSPWGPKVKGNVSRVRDNAGNWIEVSTTPASRGVVGGVEGWLASNQSDPTVYPTYSTDKAIDGNWSTYALSEAYSKPDGTGANPNTVWFEFTVGAGMDALAFKPWAGGYTCYISVYQDLDPRTPTGTSEWVGDEVIPADGAMAINYVKKVNVPMQLPDNNEGVMEVFFSNEYFPESDETPSPRTLYPQKIRLTFQHLYYSHIPDAGGNRYRAGIRDLTLYRTGKNVSSWSPDFESLPWTFCMTSHPTRGYWIVDKEGWVYGFGDAADYDSDAFGSVPIEDYGGTWEFLGATGRTNRAVAIESHPDGKGYWVMDWFGHIWAYGSASHHGQYAVPDPFVNFFETSKVSARGMAITPTGNGYWVLYSNGIVRGFGDASPTYAAVPNTDVATFMQSYLYTNYGSHPGYTSYNTNLKGTAIASHPKKMGFWVTDGSGQVFAFGEAVKHGQLINRVYAKGLAGQFKLQDLEWATTIEATPTGDGYWIAFGSGRVAGFGDAKKLGKDPYIVNDLVMPEVGFNQGYVDGTPSIVGGDPYSQNLLRNQTGLPTRPGGPYGTQFYWNGQWWDNQPIYIDDGPAAFKDSGNVLTNPETMDYGFFRNILWGLARDPNGNGFWGLTAAGEVIAHDADFWGKPGYEGATGFRWKEGNFDGDYANIIKDILLWAGFLYYDPGITDNDAPSVLGRIESTGIKTDTTLQGDKFDKKTLIDVIKELAEVVGYTFRIAEDGSVIFESPNWWRAGNFDENGEPIYVTYTGETYVRETVTGSGETLSYPEGSEPFIPLVHEASNLMDHSVTLSSNDYRSEIIIGTDIPSPKDASRTGFIRYTPQIATQTYGSTPVMRNIIRPAIWVSQIFENEEERKLMAELIAMHSWFASRSGTTTIVGNPAINVGDQVRIVERNTSETYIHLVRSISSNLDVTSGVYTMSLETNWLGDADNWVLLANEGAREEYVAYLEGLLAEETPGSDEYINIQRKIDSINAGDYPYVVISERLNSWQSETQRGLVTSTGKIDSPILSVSGEFGTTSTIAGTLNELIAIGDSMTAWDSTFNGLLGSATNDNWAQKLDATVVGTLKRDAVPGATTTYMRNNLTLTPETTDALVLFFGANDMNESLSGVSPAEFKENLLWFFEQFPASRKLVVYPWRWTGYPPGEPDPAPTETEYVNYRTAAEEAATEAGSAFLDLGSLAPAPPSIYILDQIHPNAVGHQFIADAVGDIINIPLDNTNVWTFSGNITTINRVDNVIVSFDAISSILFRDVYFNLYSGGSLVQSIQVPSVGYRVNLGNLGYNDTATSYTYTLSGGSVSNGNGLVRLSFSTSNANADSVTDTILVVR